MTRLLSRHLRGMNTDFHLTVRVEEMSGAEAERALEASAVWLGEVERACSRFLPKSELCALNASAGSPFTASADLYAVVALAIAMAARTDGRFDPTILPALLAAGYTRSFDEIGQREIGQREIGQREIGQREIGQREIGVATSVATSWHSGRWREVALDATTRTITLPAGVALDLGGVAKGWAVDEVACRFLGAFPAYLIDLGGDLRAHGEPEPGKGWIIGVEDPSAAPGPGAPDRSEKPRYLAGVELRDSGVATSGSARRWWLRAGRRMSHLIDPRSGQPVERPVGERALLSCTALAPTAMEADIYAKVAFLRGYPAGLATLPAGIAGLCVFADGTLATSPGLETYLRTQRQAHD